MFLILVLSLGLTSCSSSSTDAKTLAKESCNGFNSYKGTVGAELHWWRLSSEKVAQAAAIDARWTSLVESDQTELRLWRLEADSIGMKPSDNEKKLSDAQRSEAYKYISDSDRTEGKEAWKNIQTQCAIARS
ncbi:MAG: hypothetical protein WCH43_07870 [Verrucomicrobiota bacterium]|jgi:hypothetical protein